MIDFDNYENTYDEKYRNMFYLFTSYVLKDYKDKWSYDMLELDNDSKLMNKANELKFIYHLEKHIHDYLIYNTDIKSVENNLNDEKNKGHAEINKYYENYCFNNLEHYHIYQIVDKIAEWEEILEVGEICSCCKKPKYVFCKIEYDDNDSDYSSDDGRVDWIYQIGWIYGDEMRGTEN